MRPQHRNPSKQAQQKATSKARQVVDYRADLLNLRAAFKLKLHTSLWEELTKQLQLKGNTVIS
jgi:hypothetical protein